MKQIQQQFEARLPRLASDASRHDLRAVFSIADTFRQKAGVIRDDTRLSYTGKDEALAKLRAETLQNGHFQQIRSQSAKAQERIRTERVTLRATALRPEPGDVISEMQRAEIRQMLRNLPEVERVKIAMSDDISVKEAVAFSSPLLSALPADIHGKILDGIVAIKNQTRNAELADAEAEIEVVAAAIAVTEGAITRG